MEMILDYGPSPKMPKREVTVTDRHTEEKAV